MRVYVHASLPSGRVLIRTGRGTAAVEWSGAKVPKSGEIDVELTLRGRIRWGLEATVTRADDPIGVGDDGSLVGRLEAVDPDGVIWLRVGDGLVMVAPEGTAPPLTIGDAVLIGALEIQAYPVDL